MLGVGHGKRININLIIETRYNHLILCSPGNIICHAFTVHCILRLGSESMAGATQSYVGATRAHENIFRDRIEVYRDP